MAILKMKMSEMISSERPFLERLPSNNMSKTQTQKNAC
jgi:hypothetical protein